MTTSLPPPKSGSSKPFAIAALLMLLLMGGLVYVKLSGSDEPKPEPAPPRSAPKPVIDQVIPPPPPPPEPPPSASASAPVKKSAPKNDTGCSTCGNCQGTEAGGFRGAIAGRAALAQRCYEKALGQQEQLTGKLTVGVCVGVGGQVCSARIEKDSLGSPLVAQCVLNLYRSVTFPSPKNGCVQAAVPLNFIPQKL